MAVSTTPIPTVTPSQTLVELVSSSNLAFSRIADLVTELNLLETEVGDISTLTTADKSSVVAAINEIQANFSSGSYFTTLTGVLVSLTTTNKSNLVAAINELDGDIGDLALLNTTAKTSTVDAINELFGFIGTIGNLSDLLTSDKSNIVAAINEIHRRVGNTPLATPETTLTAAVNALHLRATNSDSRLSTIESLTPEFIRRDGSVTFTGDQSMGSNRITNLAKAINPRDAVRLTDVPAASGVGDLSSLGTSDKSSAVAAINEVLAATGNTSPTGAMQLPSGTTAERPTTPTGGMFRRNTDTEALEYYDGAAWIQIADEDYVPVTGSGHLYRSPTGVAEWAPTEWLTINRPATPFLGQSGFNLDTNTQEYWNGTQWVSSSLPVVVVNSATTAAESTEYWADSSGGAFNIDMPPTPSQGSRVIVCRVGANDVTISGNGNNIVGDTTLVLDVDKSGVELLFVLGEWQALQKVVG